MNGESVFIDTVALIALCSRRDSLHQPARAALSDLARTQTRFVTSQWVLAEFLGFTAEPPLRAAAIADVRRLRASDAVEIVPATGQTWLEAFDSYCSRTDKGWSLVDCSSILICRSRGIHRVFTRDRHFEQAGLEPML